jgi:hypothetical protein
MTKLAAAVVLLFAACKSEEDYKKQKPPEPEPVAAPAEKKPPPPPKRELKPEELGKCTLKLSGAKKAEQESPGGIKAVNVSYWLSEAEKNNMMGVDGFAVNCHGPEMKFSRSCPAAARRTACRSRRRNTSSRRAPVPTRA